MTDTALEGHATPLGEPEHARVEVDGLGRAVHAQVGGDSRVVVGNGIHHEGRPSHWVGGQQAPRGPIRPFGHCIIASPRPARASRRRHAPSGPRRLGRRWQDTATVPTSATTHIAAVPSTRYITRIWINHRVDRVDAGQQQTGHGAGQRDQAHHLGPLHLGDQGGPGRPRRHELHNLASAETESQRRLDLPDPVSAQPHRLVHGQHRGGAPRCRW